MDSKPAISEVSSGGVLMRRHIGEVQVCIISTRGGRRWQLPKGHVELGEQPHETAVREVKEETGCEGRVLELVDTIAYDFMAPGGNRPARHHKQVHFFLMQYELGQTSNFDWEVDATRWFSAEEALDKLSYDNEREILRKAIDRFNQIVPAPSPRKKDNQTDHD